MRRRRIVAGIAVSGLLLVGLAACGSKVAPPPDSLGTQVDFTIPAAIANLPLTKPDGTTTTLAAYRGKTVMIADFLTLCTDICPMISANTVALGRALEADGVSSKVALLEISVDPRRDTPARLTAYQKLFGKAPPNWTLLRASAADTAKLWQYFGVHYAREKEPKHASIDWLTGKPLTYDVGHEDDLIFLDPAGRQRYIVNDDPDATPSSVPSKLVNALDSQGIVALNKPDPVGTWTVTQGVSVFSWLLNQKLAAPA